MKNRLYIKKTLKFITSTFILWAIMATTIIFFGWSITIQNQRNFINECPEQTTELVEIGFIQPEELPQVEEEKSIKCITLPARARTYLDSIGGKGIPIYITDTNTTWCGEQSVGCTTTLSRYGFRFDIITISTSVDYFLDGMENTIAHEYMHVLTTEKDKEWLNANKHLFPEGSDPVEIVADCGIEHFTGVFTRGAYIAECSDELKAISKKIIDGTLT